MSNIKAQKSTTLLLHTHTHIAFNTVYMENRDMRVNMNKAKVMRSGERQKTMQKAAR